MISKKYFISGIVIGIVLLFSYLFSLPDGKLHLFFCNVGQGDGAYLRTPSNQDMLIDGGPDDKVLSCLGRHMPFYDRTIDIVMLSHPQKDHLQGLISVIQRYTVKYFVIGIEGNESEGYRKLVEEIKRKNIPVKHLYTGDAFSLGEVKFSVLWPQKEWVASHLSGDSRVLGAATVRSDLNDFSYFVKLSYGTFDALFTGDGDGRVQPQVLKTVSIPQVEVLKYPHHGSKTGARPEFLQAVKPELAVISVGKNSYGHPTKEALDLLKNFNVTIKRTDKDGDVEVVSDGKAWGVK